MATPAATTTTPTAGAAPGAGFHQSGSLYVGDLGQDVSEAVLFETFNTIGPVASVRVCRDAQTRRSLGYAYVNFHRVEDAESALQQLNFKPIRNRPCRIMWSHRDPSLRRSNLGNIFVKGLAKNIDNRTLYDTFNIFGQILSCKVAMNAKGESLGYGFVHFENEQSATDAIKRVDGKIIANEKVTVAAFKSKKERGINKNYFTNLYVKGLPADWSKEKLEQMFAKHGTITSSMIAVDKEQKTRGFAFVNFQAPEEAEAAITALNGFDIGDAKKLFVGRAQKKEEREKELRERFEARRAERQRKFEGVNLYVKNLSDDFDDEKLRNEFTKFGSISSAKVMKDPATQKSRGFGFVCLSSPEEATKAVSEMNGKMVDGKPLYVALHQRKEIRRQQLETRFGGVHGAGPMQRGQHPGMMAGGPQMFPGPAGPLYYPPRNFPMNMYGPAPGGRGGWQPMQNQMMAGRMGGQMGPYQMMAAQPGMGQQAGSPQGMNRRQPGQGGRRPGGPQSGIEQKNTSASSPGGGAGAQNQNFRYEQNVRNQNQQRAPTNPVNENVPEPSSVSASGKAPTLQETIKALAAAPDDKKKQIIGEQLFVRIRQIEPSMAGKITGMLLEMDNSELIALLESPESLNEKIMEAREVLEQHLAEQQKGSGGGAN